MRAASEGGGLWPALSESTGVASRGGLPRGGGGCEGRRRDSERGGVAAACGGAVGVGAAAHGAGSWRAMCRRERVASAARSCLRALTPGWERLPQASALRRSANWSPAGARTCVRRALARCVARRRRGVGRCSALGTGAACIAAVALLQPRAVSHFLLAADGCRVARAHQRVLDAKFAARRDLVRARDVTAGGAPRWTLPPGLVRPLGRNAPQTQATAGVTGARAC